MLQGLLAWKQKRLETVLEDVKETRKALTAINREIKRWQKRAASTSSK